MYPVVAAPGIAAGTSSVSGSSSTAAGNTAGASSVSGSWWTGTLTGPMSGTAGPLNLVERLGLNGFSGWLGVTRLGLETVLTYRLVERLGTAELCLVGRLETGTSGLARQDQWGDWEWLDWVEQDFILWGDWRLVHQDRWGDWRLVLQNWWGDWEWMDWDWRLSSLVDWWIVELWLETGDWCIRTSGETKDWYIWTCRLVVSLCTSDPGLMGRLETVTSALVGRLETGTSCLMGGLGRLGVLGLTYSWCLTVCWVQDDYDFPREYCQIGSSVQSSESCLSVNSDHPKYSVVPD